MNYCWSIDLERKMLKTFAKVKDLRFKLVHYSWCGGTAFYLERMPCKGERLRSDIVRDLNGDKIQPGSVTRCFSCGKKFKPKIDDIEFNT